MDRTMGAIMWIDPVLGSAGKVRVLRALSRGGHAFTEAELARAIGMSPNTVNLAVRELEEARVVTVLASGRAHRVALNRGSPFADAVRALFASEAEGVAFLAEAVRAVLAEDESCVLFGSAARGTMRPSSDVDLLIVAHTWDAAAEASVRVGQAARQVCPKRYRMLHYTPAELRRKWDTPLLQAIREEGILLGGRPLEAFR